MKRVKMITKRGGKYFEGDDDTAFRKNRAKRKRREFWCDVGASVYANKVNIAIACVVALIIAWNV